MSRALEILAELLAFPTDAAKASTHRLADELAECGELPPRALPQVDAVLATLARNSLQNLQFAHVKTFSRLSGTSLDLREHLDADEDDARALGRLTAELRRESGGGDSKSWELPGALGWLASMPKREMRSRLAVLAPVLRRLQTRLAQLGSPYAGLVGAVMDLHGIERSATARAAPRRVARAHAEAAAQAA